MALSLTRNRRANIVGEYSNTLSVVPMTLANPIISEPRTPTTSPVKGYGTLVVATEPQIAPQPEIVPGPNIATQPPAEQPDTPDSETKDTPKKSKAVWIIIGIAGVVLLLLMFNKKKK